MRFTLFLLLLFFAPPASATPRVIEGDGFNLKLLRSNDTEIFLEPRDKKAAHNWFAASFDGLPLYSVTWRVDMNETGTDFKGNMRKWQGVKPVISYADPQKYEAFIWYYKESDGVWISSDPLLEGRAREAGRGKLPLQNVVAPALATEFLSADGLIWSPWRDIETSSADTTSQTFSFSTAVKAPRATVAMRVPYLNGFEDQFVKRLQARQLPGVFVDELGKTVEGRSLRVFRLDDPNPTVPLEQQQTMLIYARENATDHDASWVAFGALAGLLRDDETARKLRANTTWLLVPLADPDGAANSNWKGLQDEFFPTQEHDRPEPLLYARYFLGRANQGRSVDLDLGFHMLEGDDNPLHLVCVFTPTGSGETITYLNSKWFPLLQKQGYLTSPPRPTHDTGGFSRFGNWVSRYLGAYHGVYQVNSRVPGNHLALHDLMFLGEMSVQSMNDYAWNEGLETHDLTVKFNDERLEKQRAHFAKDGIPGGFHGYIFYLMMYGFLPPPEELAKLDERGVTQKPK